MAIDERKILAEDGTVFAAVDVTRSLVPGQDIEAGEVRACALGSKVGGSCDS